MNVTRVILEQVAAEKWNPAQTIRRTICLVFCESPMRYRQIPAKLVKWILSTALVLGTIAWILIYRYWYLSECLCEGNLYLVMLNKDSGNMQLNKTGDIPSSPSGPKKLKTKQKPLNLMKMSSFMLRSLWMHWATQDLCNIIFSYVVKGVILLWQRKIPWGGTKTLIFSDSKAAHQIWTQNTVGCLLEAMTNRSRFWIEICLELVNSHGDTTSCLFSVYFFWSLFNWFWRLFFLFMCISFSKALWTVFNVLLHDES